jgi:hypothetical protein
MQTETTRYPFINLSKALEKADILYKADPRRNSMLIATVFEAWGYSLKSSGGHQTVAALIMYGLVEDEGSRETRRLRLTEDAHKYFRDERDEKKIEHLRQFALKPKLLRSLWSDWRNTPPADAVARSHLKLDRGLNEQSARALLGIYKDNLRFANLDGLDHVHSEDSGEAITVDETPILDAREDRNRQSNIARGNFSQSESSLPLVEGERELASGLLSKQTSFRLLVTGPLGIKEIEVLIRKLEIDKEVIADED